MKLGKREKIMLIILGALVYSFVFIKLIFIPVVPQIKDVNAQIKSLKQQKASLDSDIVNINSIKSNLEVKNTNIDRLKDYVLEYVNIPDGIEYLDKLDTLIGLEGNYQINLPTEFATASGKKFYEMKLAFNTKLEYEEAMNLIKYFEKGSMKIRISKFSMKPVGSSGKLTQDSSQSGSDENKTQNIVKKPISKTLKFDISIEINLYAMNMMSSDKLYEYSRFKFSNYSDRAGSLFTENSNKAVSTPKQSDSIAGEPNILINEESYLSAGPNLKISGFKAGSSILRIKTKTLNTINISMDDYGYSVDTIDEAGKVQRMSGNVQGDSLVLSINMEVPDIIENKDIALNLKITNSSKKHVYITMKDDQKRVKVLDRKGNQILGDSTSEKVTIS